MGQPETVEHAISGQAGHGLGLGSTAGNSGVGIGNVSGTGMNTTGSWEAETAFHTNPLAILSSLLQLPHGEGAGEGLYTR